MLRYGSVTKMLSYLILKSLVLSDDYFFYGYITTLSVSSLFLGFVVSIQDK